MPRTTEPRRFESAVAVDRPAAGVLALEVIEDSAEGDTPLQQVRAGHVPRVHPQRRSGLLDWLEGAVTVRIRASQMQRWAVMPALMKAAYCWRFQPLRSTSSSYTSGEL